MSENNVLSAVDLLGLADERLVMRVDLATIGRSGVVFVRELTADEKAKYLPRPKGRTRMHKDQSLELDWSQLPPDAAAKFLKTCLVEIVGGPDAFYSNGEETAVIPADKLKPIAEAWLAKLGKPHLVLEEFGKLPNAVVDLLVARIRKISRLDVDEEDEEDAKKN